MSLFSKLFQSSRLRQARQALAGEPSAANYLALAQEHARLGEMTQVQEVCGEGLDMHPADPELLRMAERARTLALEDRTRELKRQLRDAPRPALYRELAELYLAAGRVERADELALQWFTDSGDGEAALVRARARVARFQADKRREDARLAVELMDTAERALPRDPRPLRAKLELYSLVGAWRDARRIVSQLLELAPGDGVLEARFRNLNALAETAPAFDAALRECERTGQLASEAPSHSFVTSASKTAIRPLLQDLAAQPGVQSVSFERGATALVQGPRGATAERTARAVREIVGKGRATARRLGLGSPREIEIEGVFGSVYIAPSEHGSAAVWCSQPTVPAKLRVSARALVGANDLGAEEEPQS